MYDENSFYSLDRLVQFGMGMAVAQQMIHTMNQTMRNMHVPGAGNPLRPPEQAYPERLYYAVLEGKQAGPFSEPEMARLIAEKKVSRETYVWHPGLCAWKTAETVPELVRLAALAPPPLDQTRNAGGTPDSAGEGAL